VIALWDEAMLGHQPGAGHPERSERLRAAHAALSGLQGVTWREVSPASRSAVLAVHSEAYLVQLEACRGRRVRLDADTVTSPGSVEAAFLAAGAAIGAVDAIMEGEDRRAFALVRPPGHHAERERAMGFCLLNNIAIAAAHACTAHGLERVLVVDWDVHHGNGTQHIFEERSDVFFYSSHRGDGFYPGTGAASERGLGDGLGYTLNWPLRPGDGDAALLEGIHHGLLPAVEAYSPQLVLVSAGFDAHVSDPLGGLAVTEAGFAGATERLIALAERFAEGRIAMVLEGGYDLDGLGACVRSVARAMGAT